MTEQQERLTIVIAEFAVKFGLDAAIALLSSTRSATIDDAIAALQKANTKTADDYVNEARNPLAHVETQGPPSPTTTDT